MFNLNCCLLIVSLVFCCLATKSVHSRIIADVESDEFFDSSPDPSNSNEDFHFEPSIGSQESDPKSLDSDSSESLEHSFGSSYSSVSSNDSSFVDLCKNVRCSSGHQCHQTTSTTVDCIPTSSSHSSHTNATDAAIRTLNRYLAIASHSKPNHASVNCVSCNTDEILKSNRIHQRAQKFAQILKSNHSNLNHQRSASSIHESHLHHFTCSASQQLQTGLKLFDWLALLWNQRGRPSSGALDTSHSDCARPLRWMFAYLDTDQDQHLTLTKLYDTQSPENISDQMQAKSQFCVRAFINSCDVNQDKKLDATEWCSCFDQFQPCAVERKRLRILNHNRKSILKPQCDSNGRYQPLQCDSISGHCWCVDQQGRAVTHRTLDLIDCEKNANAAEQMSDSSHNQEQDEDAETDDEDDDQDRSIDSDEEGSGDMLLPA